MPPSLWQLLEGVFPPPAPRLTAPLNILTSCSSAAPPVSLISLSGERRIYKHNFIDIIYRRNLCPEAGPVLWWLCPAFPLVEAKVAEKVCWSLLPREKRPSGRVLGGKKASPSVTDLTINLQINAQVPKVHHPAWHVSYPKTACRLISHLGGTAEGRLWTCL